MTPKQQRFVEEYLVDLNASAAARRAGYSPKRADQQALENLRKPEIAAAIAERRAKVSEQTGRTIAAVMADLAMVRINAMELVDDPGTGTRTMRSHKDALRALELEGKHLGAFDERMRLLGPDGGPVKVTRIELVPLAAAARKFRRGQPSRREEARPRAEPTG